MTLYGRAGYLLLEDDDKIDNDGTEIAIGARFGVLPFLSLFGEYRSLTLDPDQGGKFEVDGFRLGRAAEHLSESPCREAPPTGASRQFFTLSMGHANHAPIINLQHNRHVAVITHA